MKNTLVAIGIIFSSLVGYSQTTEIKTTKKIQFNKNDNFDYEETARSTCNCSFEFKLVGTDDNYVQVKCDGKAPIKYFVYNTGMVNPNSLDIPVRTNPEDYKEFVFIKLDNETNRIEILFEDRGEKVVYTP